jgi:DNA-binding response OmpR family regulator
MEPVPHVLVVDDHREIRDLLARYLTKQGLRVSTAESAAAARRLLQASAPDLVVLDIMMPGEDGLALCRHLRATRELPIILLTALAEDTDRIIGLEIGADDYLAKPFNPRELLARIKAVPGRCRRSAAGWARPGCASTAGCSMPGGASSFARTASRCRSAPASSSSSRPSSRIRGWCCRATSCST